ncbi:oxidoreductase [Paenibacillus physcomitrellae]|uniref:Short-chain dehydrogenase/reductase n=1 Tax=Paenibacillus physcomitrellae TaxID=1619311 RepID=A0ABQ1FQA0_9BACL|nr:oxidoreductase [Paenibacillus physcomitrellae]GGA24528.1 short-chain dehydrogenase/reductase [Paenibacillus physcomitrellae]
MGKKIVLITGASSGIGKESARKLLAEGHVVYTAARRVEQMQDLKQAGAIPLRLDISNEDEIKAVVDRMIKEQGRIDVLFNNAGFGLYGSVEEVSIEDARYQFEVNLFGLARLTQLVVPHMRAKQSGTIINTSSVGGKIYTPLGAWYHATKHALEGWSDCLRIELKPFEIHVVVIEPGIITTSFGDAMGGSLLKNSGNGPYKKMAKGVEKISNDSYQAGGGSSPIVVANAVSRAIAADRPKPRYAVGKMAKPLILMRKWLSDHSFDRLILSQVK